jgi:hypothetical protein
VICAVLHTEPQSQLESLFGLPSAEQHLYLVGPGLGGTRKCEVLDDGEDGWAHSGLAAAGVREASRIYVEVIPASVPVAERKSIVLELFEK